MVLRKAIKIVEVGDRWEVREPGYHCRALPAYAVYFTKVKKGRIVLSQDLGRTYIRMGKLDDDILNAQPEFFTSQGRNAKRNARRNARRRAYGLALKLAQHTKLPIVYP